MLWWCCQLVYKTRQTDTELLISSNGRREEVSKPFVKKKWKIVVSDTEAIENAKKPVLLKNTKKATDWAVGVFK